MWKLPFYFSPLKRRESCIAKTRATIISRNYCSGKLELFRFCSLCFKKSFSCLAMLIKTHVGFDVVRYFQNNEMWDIVKEIFWSAKDLFD